MKYIIENNHVKFVLATLNWTEINKTYQMVDQEVNVVINGQTILDSEGNPKTRIVKVREVVKEEPELKELDIFTEEHKTFYIQRLENKNVEYTVTDQDQPNNEIMSKLIDKLFNTKEEVQQIIDSIMNKTIDQYRNEKIEELRNACHNSIIGGFMSDASGESVLYGYDLEDQANWDKLFNVVSACRGGDVGMIQLLQAQGIPEGEINVKAKGNSNWIIITFNQFMKLYSDSLIHLNSNRLRLYNFFGSIEAATTKEELDEIYW